MLIPPDVQAEILALHSGAKKGTRSIARALGVNRKAVRRVIETRQVREKPLITGTRRSILDPFKPKIERMLSLDPTLTASRILQTLRQDGYLGGYSILKGWVSAHRERPSRSREAFLRLDFPAGETAQVDWGEFGTPFGDGVKAHCFLMVLAHSRLLYIEFTRSEKFEEFIRCHENAFRFFGDRVPLEIWYDNLTSAVTERMGQLVRFNARFLAYLGHHGIRPHACNPARGNEKGRVEDGVKYVRSSFWAGRTFTDFDDLGRQATQWRDEIANRREHRSTRKIPALYFESAEKPLLRPMNPAPYDTTEVFSRVVPPNFLIAYETNRYSVPWTLVGLTLTVRVGDQILDFYYHERRVARHVRSYRKQQIFESREHFQGLLERKPGATKESWQIAAVKNIGPAMGKYLDLVRVGHRSMRHEVSRILALATIYGDSAVNTICQELLTAGILGVESLELTLKNRMHPSEHALSPEPLRFQNTKLNRVVPTVDLRRYDALLFGSATSAGNRPAGETPPASTPIESVNHEHDDTDRNRAGDSAGHDPGQDDF
jgi:transposase